MRALQVSVTSQHAALEGKLDDLLAERAEHGNCTGDDDGNSTASGAVAVTYNRWGRTTCPDTGATLVYEGER